MKLLAYAGCIFNFFMGAALAGMAIQEEDAPTYQRLLAFFVGCLYIATAGLIGKLMSWW